MGKFSVGDKVKVSLEHHGKNIKHGCITNIKFNHSFIVKLDNGKSYIFYAESMQLEDRDIINESNKLNRLRHQIDNIDEQIVELLCERLDAVQEVAEYKKAHGLEILHKEREVEILKEVENNIEEDIYKKYILEIYNKILETSKSLQEELNGHKKT